MYACRTGQAQTHQARQQARLDRARPGNRLAWPGCNRPGARPGQAGKKWPVGISDLKHDTGSIFTLSMVEGILRKGYANASTQVKKSDTDLVRSD